MNWALALAVAALAAPYGIEALRRPMDATARKGADGSLAHLRQGVTHYRWDGPENGPVAVCIHGLTTPRYTYDGLIPHLADMGFRVLSYDLYGRGFSDRPFGRQDADFFCRQPEELLRDQEIDGSVTLIGNSMGSAISTAFAARHPDRVRQVVLLVPAGMGHELGMVAKIAQRVPGIGDWLIQALYPRTLRKGSAAERDTPGTVPGIADRQVAELRYRGLLRSVTASLRGMLSPTQDAEHRAVHAAGVPVIAVWGARDSVIPITCKGRLESANPDAEQVVIDDAGHGLVYTHTQDLVERITPVLKKG
ncbi:Pimeloyl-ACP methyl ester carboxylesterase [Salinihabitans flavidus]|uniref:Pimeloyl-ACP methyl ester carboxylesterase n=1 Tax=Salinihabitans flavidus TaxID=569882 RepID=A0A1H8UUZ5_9RHOB|nr:alpha/beta hydrolase [Salinihabitans flavidus]SEP06813.1 Pimeloyl-ACP methyl ester carboxylesterase [Salinihabitans flavidus]